MALVMCAPARHGGAMNVFLFLRFAVATVMAMLCAPVPLPALPILLHDPPPGAAERIASAHSLFDESQRHSGTDATASPVTGTGREVDTPSDVPNTIRQGRHAWPTGSKARVLRDFNPPEKKWMAGHRGVDLELAEGSLVHASAAGVVVWAGQLAGRNVISIEHENGLRTTYEPVSPVIVQGDTVQAGETIGFLDAGHCGESSCLHWGAKRSKDSYVNPLSLLEPRTIRLVE